MLVHEIVTNSVKHAFPDDRPGRITVSLRRDGDTVRLVARDDGEGDGSAAAGGHDSIGKQLIASLSGQLCGRLTVSGQVGTTVTVEMPATLFTFADWNAGPTKGIVSTTMRPESQSSHQIASTVTVGRTTAGTSAGR